MRCLDVRDEGRIQTGQPMVHHTHLAGRRGQGQVRVR